MVLRHMPCRESEHEFHVRCNTSGDNRFSLGADSVEVTVGQLLLRRGAAEIWDSVSLYAQAEPDGALAVRVVVFHPDWEEPLQIACIRSRPRDRGNGATLGCNLDHVIM